MNSDFLARTNNKGTSINNDNLSLTNTLIHALLFALVLFLFSGCVVNKPFEAVGIPFSPAKVSDDKARIIVFWTEPNIPGLYLPTILVAGKSLGELDPLGYFEEYVDPGEITISARYTATEINRLCVATVITNVTGGSEYYVQFNETGYFNNDKPKLTFLGFVEGREAAMKTRKTGPDVELQLAKGMPVSPVATNAAPESKGTNAQSSIHLSALGKRFQSGNDDMNNGRIVIYTVRDTGPGAKIQPSIYIAGKDVGILEPSGYLDLMVPPGETLVAARWNFPHPALQVISKVRVTPGSETYVRFRPKGGYHWLDHLELTAVDAEVGQREASGTRKSQPSQDAIKLTDTNSFATVRFMRTINILALANSLPTEIFVDGVSLGELNETGVHGMKTAKVPPGEATIAVRWPGREAIFNDIETSFGSSVGVSMYGQRWIILQVSPGATYDFKVSPEGADRLLQYNWPLFTLKPANFNISTNKTAEPHVKHKAE